MFELYEIDNKYYIIDPEQVEHNLQNPIEVTIIKSQAEFYANMERRQTAEERLKSRQSKPIAPGSIVCKSNLEHFEWECNAPANLIIAHAVHTMESAAKSITSQGQKAKMALGLAVAETMVGLMD